MTVLLSALAATAVAGSLLCLEMRLAPAWAERGMPLPNRITARITRAVLALALALAAALWQPAVSPRAAAAVAAAATGLAWLLILGSETDLRFRKIPFEACWAATAIGVLAAAATTSTRDLLTLAGAGVIVAAVYLLAILTRGAGRGDLRLIAALAASMSWWTGLSALLAAVTCACLAQLALRAVASLARSRRGRLATAVAGLAGPPIGTIRAKRVYPMAPGIALGALLACAIALATGFTPCHEWPGTLASSCTTTGS